MTIVKKNFENYLTSMGTDYIDFGMLFFIDSEEDYRDTFDGGLADYALELKKKGVIRAIGASSHNPVIATKVVNSGIVDSLLFSINPAFDLYPVEDYTLGALETGLDSSKFVGIDPDRAAFYRLCEQKNVGITVMKTLCSGKLLSPEQTPFKKPLSVGQCIHYALTRPAVASVLIGSSTPDEVAESVAYLNLSDEERDYSEAISAFQGKFSGSCVYCNHCLPCPSEIDVAALTKYLDIAKLDENSIPPSIRHHYESLERKGSDCIQCGSCMERCPFSVDIMGNMQKAQSLFGV
jgi:predicted aldo/keto reductase-like oxidoreductase